MESQFLAAVWALTPTLFIGALFAWVLRLILRADRVERRVFKKLEDEERLKAGLPPKS